MSPQRKKRGPTETHFLGLDGLGQARPIEMQEVVLHLAEALTALGVEVCKIQTHQLAPQLPQKTPHGNNCYSLGIHWDAKEISVINDVETAWEVAPELQLESFCLHFLHSHNMTTAVGAFCIASRAQLLQLAEELRIYATRVKQEAVTSREAWQLCERANILLEEIAGGGAGVVGALAAIVLHRAGQGTLLSPLHSEAKSR